MIVGLVVGQVVCTQKDKSLVGKKMLVVQPLRIDDMKPSGQAIVALDAIGSGAGEVVMVVGGSSARMADDYSKVCVDQSIVAIIDTIELGGSTVFSKG
ncbi:MAG: EutN/CcmL family microcompartment protein [Spirochaetes bacterium]|nr:EutN/CcmL family microcompartment protein [Spirochaetota bacterium]